MRLLRVVGHEYEGDPDVAVDALELELHLAPLLPVVRGELSSSSALGSFTRVRARATLLQAPREDLPLDSHIWGPAPAA